MNLSSSRGFADDHRGDAAGGKKGGEMRFCSVIFANSVGVLYER
jgi:hypothetical protein